MSRGAQRLTLRLAAHAWEVAQVIHGLTQGQALRNPAIRVTSVMNILVLRSELSRVKQYKQGKPQCLRAFC
jgi:hypothetical protein